MLKLFDTKNFQKNWWDALQNFLVLSDKNFRWKFVIPQFCIVFQYRKLSETAKRTLTNFFWQATRFRNLFVIPSTMVHQKFCTRQVGSHRNTRNFQKYQKGFHTSLWKWLLELWYFETKSVRHFLVIPPYGSRKISRWRDEQRQFWRVLSLLF